MKKQHWKPGALLAPVPPTLVTCGTMDAPNILTVAWTGILSSTPAKTYISVRPQRHSYDIIKEQGEFVINLPTAPLVRATDFCGVRSGRDLDKFAAMGLTPVPAPPLGCPQLDESPVSILCRVTDILALGSHDMFLADIVGVEVAEEAIDPSGKLRLDRCQLLAYCHGEYFALGKRLGTFGYSVRKKKAKPAPKKK